ARPKDIPTAFTSVMPEDIHRVGAKIYERDGKYYIHCLNTNCGTEIELPNPDVKRFHCPDCGRRNKIALWEG
ncbi:MAG: hypothetical protein KAU14_08750, partial [Thermoplasmata archaeon]|nr:hypothetical protein [Thermoplasmata archaeon]